MRGAECGVFDSDNIKQKDFIDANRSFWNFMLFLKSQINLRFPSTPTAGEPYGFLPLLGY
jgi:hypothetical protein